MSISRGGVPRADTFSDTHGAAWLYYKTVVQSPPVNAIVLANLAPMLLPYLRWRGTGSPMAGNSSSTDSSDEAKAASNRPRTHSIDDATSRLAFMDRVVCGSTAFGWVVYMGVIVPRYAEIVFGGGTAASTPTSTLLIIAGARAVALGVYTVGIAANLKAHALSCRLALRKAITGSKHKRFRDVVRSLMCGKAALRRENAHLRQENARLAATVRELRRRARRDARLRGIRGTFQIPPPQQHGETGLRRVAAPAAAATATATTTTSKAKAAAPATPTGTMIKYLTKKCGLRKSAAKKVAKKYMHMFPGRFDEKVIMGGDDVDHEE